MMAYTCNPRAYGVKAGGSHTQGNFWLNNETLDQNPKSETKYLSKQMAGGSDPGAAKGLGWITSEVIRAQPFEETARRIKT